MIMYKTFLFVSIENSFYSLCSNFQEEIQTYFIRIYVHWCLPVYGLYTSDINIATEVICVEFLLRLFSRTGIF